MAADPREVLVWRAGALSPEPDEPARLVVADSFLAAEGGVVDPDRHRARFLFDVSRPEIAALADLPDPADAAAFWDSAVATLPAIGSWFPRVELAATDREALLRLRLRPSPPLTRTLSLATWTGTDPRRVPGVKGPDLDALMQARAAVAASGADEALLLTADGAVADGTTSALMWWRGDRLCLPATDIPRVASVTAAVLVDLAAADGVPVTRERSHPEDLAGLEIWAVNALHGIRGVDRWVGGPRVAVDHERLDAWRGLLEARRRPVTAPGTSVPSP